MPDRDDGHLTVGAPIVLITGASRGVGAETARLIGRNAGRVFVNYRDKDKRAQQVVEQIAAAGGRARALKADVTQTGSVAEMMGSVRALSGGLDILILNASGGLERDADADYAMRVNHDAQLDVVEQAMALPRPPSRVVFVTSHAAHFLGRHSVLPEYLPVAESKRAGETALRTFFQTCAEGVTLIVVSGDMIDGTISARLLEKARPGLVEARQRVVGRLPTIDEFAGAVAAGATDPDLPSGHTIYVGGEDYLD